MKLLVQLIALILFLGLIVSCASGPGFDNQTYQPQTTPKQVVDDIDNFLDKNVLWGGMLISSSNLENGTQLEVLGYPLHSNQRPNIDESPLGRFLVMEGGYLESVDFTGGRLVTITGSVARTHIGEVGSSQYHYPVINADQIHLWPKQNQSFGSRFHFGFGISISN